MRRMNIGVIGAGFIGSTLGSALAASGHSVTYGTRDPGSVAAADFFQIRPNPPIADAVSHARRGALECV